MKFVSINAPTPDEEPLGLTLRIQAPPGTDLWRKPPSHDVQNATCRITSFSAKQFRRAHVTVSADWTRLYDQGGIVLFLPDWPDHNLWLKTGIEFVDGRPYVSAVATRDAADWSLFPVPGGKTKITLEIEREDVDEKRKTGSSLWVYLVEGDGRTAIREITWVFKEGEDMAGRISVGFYAARPTRLGKDDLESLEVLFESPIITLG